MSMSEETKVRLMVVPVVAMLAVTMIVAGWQHEEQVEIEVEEGYDEMTVEYVNPGGNIPIDNNTVVENTTVVTEIVNNKGELIFDVDITGIALFAGINYVEISLSANGNLDEDLSPEFFKFTGRMLPGKNNLSENVIHFIEPEDSSRWSLWPQDEQDIGARGDDTTFVGCYLEENDFEAESRLIWDIPIGNEEPFTLELKAVVEGLYEEVSATVHVNIVPPEGGVDR